MARYTGGMRPIIQTVRAIGAEFIRRTLRPLILIGGAVVAILLIAGIWLVNQNIWWWLLLAVVLAASIVFITLAIVVTVVVKLADSVQSRQQRQAVRHYVDKLQRTAENVQTPYPIILFRVVRDVIRPQSDGFIATMSQDTKTLAPDFNELVDYFRSAD